MTPDAWVLLAILAAAVLAARIPVVESHQPPGPRPAPVPRPSPRHRKDTR